MKELWKVPILIEQFEGVEIESMNAELRAEILDRGSREAPLTIGTTNAAKVGQDILRSSSSDAVGRLRQLIVGAAATMTEHVLGKAFEAVVDDFVAEAWAVIYRLGGNHRIHTHPGAAWSGVYYVSCPEDAQGGRIEFLDPRPAALAFRGDAPGTVSLQPRPGMMVGFPSWLQHNVTPLANYDERICIAYNVGFAAEEAHA